jgi:hypothetical protein
MAAELAAELAAEQDRCLPLRLLVLQTIHPAKTLHLKEA